MNASSLDPAINRASADAGDFRGLFGCDHFDLPATNWTPHQGGGLEGATMRLGDARAAEQNFFFRLDGYFRCLDHSSFLQNGSQKKPDPTRHADAIVRCKLGPILLKSRQSERRPVQQGSDASHIASKLISP